MVVRRLAAWQRHTPATRRIKTYKSLCRETEARSEATKTRAKLPDCSRAPPRARKPIEACGGPGVSHHPSTPTRLFHRGMQHASEMRSKVRPTVTKAHVNLCQSCTKVWWFSVLAAYGQTRLASARHVRGTGFASTENGDTLGKKKGFCLSSHQQGPHPVSPLTHPQTLSDSACRDAAAVCRYPPSHLSSSGCAEQIQAPIIWRRMTPGPERVVLVGSGQPLPSFAKRGMQHMKQSSASEVVRMR